MAQICKLKPGRKYPNTKKGRTMIRDPRQKIGTDNFSLREQSENGHKLVKSNSLKRNKSKAMALEDRGVQERMKLQAPKTNTANLKK